MLAPLWGTPPYDGAEKWKLTEISGHLPDLRFSLVDDNGTPVTARHYRGDIVLLYFGFAGCSAECPVTLARLSNVFNSLGKDAQFIRLLFVSINPVNDTPQVMHAYLSSFTAPITGLTGSGYAIEALSKRLRGAYRAGYAVGGNIPHSNAIYIFDRYGHARLLAAPQDDNSSIIHDIRQLLHG